MYNTCYYREKCDHSKKHEIITNTFGNNCEFNNFDEPTFVHGQEIRCCCDTTMLRKEKLKKINRL
jgi:hypothetical protein